MFKKKFTKSKIQSQNQPANQASEEKRLPQKQNLKEEQKEVQPKQNKTSWGKVGDWYDDYLENPESYQKKVIEPNLIRILGSVTGKKILDVGCGQGFFSRLFAGMSADVTGVDISPELIKKAIVKSEAGKQKKTDRPTGKINYIEASADNMNMIQNASHDLAISVLAAQNIQDFQKAVIEIKRILKPGGRFIFVINHPSFRIPQDADWYYDDTSKRQGRLVTKYMSESTVKIDMHPGQKFKIYTYSFHRPLQVFIKWLVNNGMGVTRLEEWISHKESANGPRKDVEDRARREIPLFMCIEATILVQ